jgi:hypothetical protein
VSALPLIFKCGQSQGGDIRVDEAGGEAARGVATHKVLESVAAGRGVDWDSVPAVAEEYGVEASDLGVMVAAGVTAWANAGFGPSLTEVALSSLLGDSDVMLTGHLDWVRGNRGGDWKTGRSDSDYSQQMRGYAALLLLDDASLTSATMSIVWLRDQQIESYTMTRDALAAWSASVVEALDDPTFRTGQHCQYCKRSATCPGARARQAEAVRAIQTTGETAIDDMEPDAAIDLYNQAKTVAGLAERVTEAIKARATKAPIEGEKRRLVMVDEKRREVDTLLAWPVLQEHLSTEDMAGALDVRVSRAEEAIRKAAPRGLAAKHIRDFKAALESSGAVTMTTQQKIKEMRK